MSKIVNIAGQRFGRLTVISVANHEEWKGPRSKWVCRCDCGKVVLVSSGNLKSKSTVSCGCYGKEIKTKHGLSGTPEHQTWKRMKARCLNPNSKDYYLYGGRGIKVCDRWLEDFQAFFDDMGSRPSSNHSLDRINYNGNYEPSNCRWATVLEQARNQRKNIFVDSPAGPICLAEAASIAGLRFGLVYDRRRNGWDERDWFIPAGAPRCYGLKSDDSD